MVKLRQSQDLQRKIRQDDWADLGKSTWALAEAAIKAGQTEDALDLVEYGRGEVDRVRYVCAELANALATYVGDKFGDEEIERAWRYIADTRHANLRSSRTPPDVAEMVRRQAELQRGHNCGPSGRGDITVVEEPDRYILVLNPCGSGGRMRKSGLYGVTKSPLNWSWGKAGVSYYCAHCCLYWEVMMTETRGYPVRIHENVDKPDEPCLQIFYKKPELIPEKYFTRIGAKRDPSKFQTK